VYPDAFVLVQDLRVGAGDDIDEGTDALLRLVADLQAGFIQLEGVVVLVETAPLRTGVAVRMVVRGGGIAADSQTPGGEQVRQGRNGRRGGRGGGRIRGQEQAWRDRNDDGGGDGASRISHDDCGPRERNGSGTDSQNSCDVATGAIRMPNTFNL